MDRNGILTGSTKTIGLALTQIILDPPCRQGREAPIDTTEHKTFRKERSHVIARH